MEKRGELTSSQIVALVLTILGFLIVVVFLLVYLDAETYGDEEACKLSVITRATAPSEFERLLPLKCTTNKICLRTNTKEKCAQFIGEKNVDYVNLPSGNDQKNKEAARKIEQVSADALYKCWKMMGEGKLDLFGGQDGNPIKNFALEQFILSEIKPRCVICSRVALSEELKTKTEILNKVNVNRYMAENNPADSQLTYLKIFTDEQIGNYPVNFTQNVTGSNGTQTDEIAFIFMQILADKSDPIEQAIQKGTNTGVAIGGGLLLTPAGKVTAVTGTTIAVVGTIVAAAMSGGISYYRASVNQGLAATTCGQFGSVKEKRYGCSIFTPTDYRNISNINNLCNGGIEGNP